MKCKKCGTDLSVLEILKREEEICEDCSWEQITREWEAKELTGSYE